VWRVTTPGSRFAAWAGAPTESAVTRVTKVAETPNPSFSTVLGAAAEVTRAAVPKIIGVTVPNPSAIEVTQVTQRPTTRFPRKPVDDQYSNPGTRVTLKMWNAQLRRKSPRIRLGGAVFPRSRPPSFASRLRMALDPCQIVDEWFAEQRIGIIRKLTEARRKLALCLRADSAAVLSSLHSRRANA
jgi:hypothetical protein